MVQTIIKPTIILMAITFFSAFVLSHLYKITRPNIDRQAKEKQKKALQIVLPGYTIDSEKGKRSVKVGAKTLKFWIASKKITEEKTRKEKIINAYAFIASMPGYSGDLVSMVGVDQKGKVLGISILQQSETPGLGAKCIEVASKVTFFGFLFGPAAKSGGKVIPWFQDQFTGLKLTEKIKLVKKGNWNPSMRESLLKKNAISSITGSTITSRAVSDSLEKGYGLLKKALKKLENKKQDNKEEKNTTIKNNKEQKQ